MGSSVQFDIKKVSKKDLISALPEEKHYLAANLLPHCKEFESIYDLRAFLLKEADDLWKKIAKRCMINSHCNCKLPDPCPSIVFTPSRCKNVSKEEFQEELKVCGSDKNRMMILHMNLGGLKTDTNVNKVKNEMENLRGKTKYSPNIVCISEYNNEDARISDLYKGPINWKVLENNKKGGVAIFADESKFTIRPSRIDLKTCGSDCTKCSKQAQYETTWVEFETKTKRKKSFFVGAIYIHPNSFTNETWKCFTDKLQARLIRIENATKKVYLVGDFNLNLLENPSEGIKYFWTMLHGFGIKLLITEPTHTTMNCDGATRTVIDHIYTNDNPGKCTSGVVLEEKKFYSCHHPIYCTNKI